MPSSSEQADRIDLVRDGQVRFRVVPDPPQGQEQFRRASVELVETLQRGLGQEVTGEAPRPVELVLCYRPAERLGRERFRIEAERLPSPRVDREICEDNGDGAVSDRGGAVPEARIVLRGSTPDALYLAACYLLQRCFGVRWLWPGASGEAWPDSARLRNVGWPVGAVEREPAFAWRWFGTGGAVWERYDPDFAGRAFVGLSPGSQRSFAHWQARIGGGGLRIADGHRWAQFCAPERYGQSHPEYFALVDGRRDAHPGDGKHGNQPCTSNPAVTRLVVDEVCAALDAQPELDGYSIGVNDGHGFCECADCLAVDEWAGAGGHEASLLDGAAAEAEPATAAGTVGPGVGGGGRAVTDRIFKFANDIAAGVRRRHPDRLLLVHVYSLFRTPPRRVTLDPQIIAHFCTPTPEQAEARFASSEAATLERLRPSAERIGIYDYLEYGGRGGVPVVVPRLLAAAIRRYHAGGARYYATQSGNGFALGWVNYAIAAHMLWQPDLDDDAVVALLDDWCATAFGAAAPALRELIDVLEARWLEAQGAGAAAGMRMEHLASALYPPPVVAHCRQLVERARASARGAEQAARIDKVAAGIEWIDVLTAACRALERVETAGAPVLSDPRSIDAVSAPALLQADAGLAAVVADAAAEWRRTQRFVAGHTGGFVLSEWWFTYYVRKRGSGFAALERLADAAAVGAL